MTFRARVDNHLDTLYTDHYSGVVTFNDFCNDYYRRFEAYYFDIDSAIIQGNRKFYPGGAPYYSQWRLNRIFLSWLLYEHPIPVETPTPAPVVEEPRVFKMVRTSPTSPVLCKAT